MLNGGKKLVCFVTSQTKLSEKCLPFVLTGNGQDLRGVSVGLYLKYSEAGPCFGYTLPWVLTERMRLWIQMVKISFLCKVARLSFRDRVRI